MNSLSLSLALYELSLSFSLSLSLSLSGWMRLTTRSSMNSPDSSRISTTRPLRCVFVCVYVCDLFVPVSRERARVRVNIVCVHTCGWRIYFWMFNRSECIHVDEVFTFQLYINAYVHSYFLWNTLSLFLSLFSLALTRSHTHTQWSIHFWIMDWCWLIAVTYYCLHLRTCTYIPTSFKPYLRLNEWRF